MTLDNFFSGYRHCEQLTLVGPLLSRYQEWTEPVIFVDGGSAFRGRQQGLVVGDGDSSQVPMDIQLDPDKDFSDLAFVLRQIPQNFNELLLLGFLGGRKDHEWFNLGETERFLDCRKPPTRVRFDDQIVAYSTGCWQLDYHGVFSVATLQENSISLDGDCQYPCSPAKLFKPLSSLGLSNIATGAVQVCCSKPVFIMLNHESNG